MPSTSKKQHNFMAAVAHSASFAKKAGVPQSVGQDFNAADKGRKFSTGGNMKKMAEGGDTIHHHLAAHHMREAAKHMKMAGGGDVIGMENKDQSRGMTTAKMGSVRTAAPSRDGIAERGKTRGMEEKMAGSTTGMKRGGRA
jgi:hypothetical protein